MNIETYSRGSFRVIAVRDRITVEFDTASLIGAVGQEARRGEGNIALRFTSDSYLSTKSISAIVQCSSIVEKLNGQMAVVAPNEEILNSLKTTGLDSLVRVFRSEDAIP
ncbi:MAG: STAS domain-containing protein [Chitinivibrionales bacterium]|nr:STAS domain-containing protein [Chitinivibrionales bacterium]MBD3396075.1 STAS domain-containing protein [Chitinivibrionales bacterium]